MGIIHSTGDPIDTSKQARQKDFTEELAALLYGETDPEEVKTLEGTEKAVRGRVDSL
ncbi:hypothetical protein [Phormidium tenue]|uniref:hypothetical protein n=1 Tax=Phormidium tenue TaxID=126344 RepID=UPI0015C523B3|nr:hypothetical protein [Phormidium tenue]MBD2233666.1 hypothetical protein [Phormidium tenue FACHB-1052]